MRIRIREDGRELQGTAKQIVEQMRSVAWGREEQPLGQYIGWVVDQVGRMMGVELDVRGGSDDELARSLVDELLRTGFAEAL
jgi:signal transduction histidine kinase